MLNDWVNLIERLLINVAEETPDLLERGVLQEAEKNAPHTIFISLSGTDQGVDFDQLAEAAYVACDRFKGDLAGARIRARYVPREQIAEVWIRHWDLLLDLQGTLEKGRPALIYTLGRSGNNPADLGAGYFYEETH